MKPGVFHKEVGHIFDRIIFSGSGSSNSSVTNDSSLEVEKKTHNKFLNAIRSLKYKNFTMFLVHCFFSEAASWSIMLVSIWLMYTLTESALATTLVVGLPTISSLLIAPAVGVLADGMNRKQLLVYISLAQGVVIGIFAVLVFMDQISVWYIYLLVFINGIFANARGPVRMSFLPNLVPKNLVLNAISLEVVTESFVRFLIPLTMGFVIKFFGSGIVLSIAAVLYIFSVLFLIQISIKSNGYHHIDIREFRGEFLGGVRYLISERLILGTICLMSVVLFCVASINMGLLPIYAIKVFDVGSEGLGILLACCGIGITFAGILTSFKSNQEGINHSVMIRLVFVISIMYMIFSRITLFEIAVPFLVFSMILVGMFWLVSATYIQRKVQESFRGRISSLVTSCGGISVLFGLSFVGYMADIIGPQLATLLSCLILITCTITFVILRKHFFTDSISIDQDSHIISEKVVVSQQ